MIIFVSQIHRNDTGCPLDSGVGCGYEEETCALRIAAFSVELARGSEDVSGARAASAQASILSSPLGAGDMHVPVNI